MHLSVAPLDRHGLRQIQHVPHVADPRARAEDHIVAFDTALVGEHGGDGAAVVAELQARHLHPFEDAHAGTRRFGREPVHGGDVVGIPALLLVQNGGDAFGLPVAEQALHVSVGGLCTLDEGGRIADGLLLLVDGGNALAHDLGADLHVADRVIVIGLGIALPDGDRMRHQLAHRRLEVVVADDAAGDARGAGRDP